MWPLILSFQLALIPDEQFEEEDIQFYEALETLVEGTATGYCSGRYAGMNENDSMELGSTIGQAGFSKKYPLPDNVRVELLKKIFSYQEYKVLIYKLILEKCPSQF